MNILRLINGTVKTIIAISSSTGVSDSNKPILTDSSGKIDSSFLPPINPGGGFADFNNQTLTSNIALTSSSEYYQYLIPSGGNREVDLPIASTVPGLRFNIFNSATSGSRRLIITENSVELIRFRRNQAWAFHSNGIQWNIFRLD